MTVTREDEERFESFKELINSMDIDTFVAIDIEALMADYMAGRYELSETPSRSTRIIRSVVRFYIWSNSFIRRWRQTVYDGFAIARRHAA